MPAHETLTPSPVGRARAVLAELSPPLVTVYASLFAAGLAVGGVSYLRRSPIREAHHAGTAAWPAHLALLVLAVLLLVVARVRRRRALAKDASGRRDGPDLRPEAGRPVQPNGGAPTAGLLLLAPLGKPAAGRIRRSCAAGRRSPGGLARLVAAAVVGLVFAYCVARAGAQVLGGLDPNFTVNAWGGPTYLGAMACHYLDCALICAASAWLASRILLR